MRWRKAERFKLRGCSDRLLSVPHNKTRFERWVLREPAAFALPVFVYLWDPRPRLYPEKRDHSLNIVIELRREVTIHQATKIKLFALIDSESILYEC